MAGRLTDANYGGENHLTYNYDVTNNLLSRSGSTPLAPAQIEDSYTYDAACQISSAGYEYDARSRQTAAPGKTFAYDGASRLTSVTADGSTAMFTYNGLGDLRTRTVGGTTTHYYHNYALGLDPIVAEKAGTAYKRFYVYTPGGSLLYSIDPATGQVRFYHFDRVGSTIFLTDGAGAVSDAYAYDPYGELLGHTGASDQPFTFVGRYGVRYEPVGGLHDMRARAYDPATARFLTRDPIWPVLRDLQSLNPYQYAAQNPLRYIDPRGTQEEKDAFRETVRTVGRWATAKLFWLLGRQMLAGLAGAGRQIRSGGPPEERLEWLRRLAELREWEGGHLPRNIRMDDIAEVIVSRRIKTEWTEAVDVLFSLMPSRREAQRFLRHSQLIWMWTSRYARTPEERMLAAHFTAAFRRALPDLPPPDLKYCYLR